MPKNNIRKLTVLALFFAVMILLISFENSLPPPPFPVPLRYGLANIVIMFAFLFFSGSDTFKLIILKALFVLLTRGLLASSLSFVASTLAFLSMFLFDYLYARKTSCFLLSTVAAIFHNLGQILIFSLIYEDLSFLYILPLLSIFSVLTALINSLFLFYLLPVFNKYIVKM